MPWRGEKLELYELSPQADPEGLDHLTAKYLENLSVRGFSPVTVQNKGKAIRAFLEWSDARGLSRPEEITRPILERYQRHLFHYRKKNGQPLSFRSQGNMLRGVRDLLAWLVKTGRLPFNPAAALEFPKPERRLPKQIFTVSEVESVLRQTDITTLMGLRDRAILETFYSTGLRRSELVRLTIQDFDRERETLLIRQGKGKKDRMIPLGERVQAWLQKYLQEARPKLARLADDGFLFLNADGGPLSANRVSKMLGDYIKAADIGKGGCCHVFRHTMATLMLEGGADIRFVQQMLGHAKLETTEIYTHVTMRKLRSVFLASHPAALLVRSRDPVEAEEQVDREALKQEAFARIVAEEQERLGKSENPKD